MLDTLKQNMCKMLILSEKAENRKKKIRCLNIYQVCFPFKYLDVKSDRNGHLKLAYIKTNYMHCFRINQHLLFSNCGELYVFFKCILPVH